jgi:hypothetical protein
MNLREVTGTTIADFEAGNAVQWTSPPGFGKTEKVNDIIKWMKTKHAGQRIGYSVLFLATASPASLNGLPWKGELAVKQFPSLDLTTGVVTPQDHRYTITEPAIPQWYIATDVNTGERLPANLFDVVLLVLEEWGQGDAETKRAAAELLRAGTVNGWSLPAQNYRLALSNNDKRDGITKEFDFLINRRSEYLLSGSALIWIEDFADKPYQYAGKTWQTLGAVKAWVQQNPTVLFEEKPKQQGPWCTPRSLAATDRYAQVMAGYNGGKVPVDSPIFIEGVNGKIGSAAGMSLIGHLQYAIDLPPYETIIADPEGTPVPTRADLQMLMAYELAGRVQPEHIAQAIQYMSRKGMPQDMRITFVSSVIRRDYQAFINEPAMKAWISKNASLISVIQSLSSH